MRQVKKQQIKVKFWICGPRTVNYNMTCAQHFFQKSLHPTVRAFNHNFASPLSDCSFEKEETLHSVIIIIKLMDYDQ